MSKITTAAFAATHPYKEERRAFARLFPCGTTWEEMVEKASAGYQPAQDVLTWWASSAPPEAASFSERIEAKRLCGTPQVSIGYFATYCRADVPGACFEARLAVQEDPFDQTYCALYCPGGTPGATWEARLAIMPTPGNRALLGRVCPGGTPGADWDARLAVQMDDEDRALLGRECPDGTPGADWDARLAVQRTPGERAYFGAMCSGLVPGATLAERLAVQMDDDGREWVTSEWGHTTTSSRRAG